MAILFGRYRRRQRRYYVVRLRTTTRDDQRPSPPSCPRRRLRIGQDCRRGICCCLLFACRSQPPLHLSRGRGTIGSDRCCTGIGHPNPFTAECSRCFCRGRQLWRVGRCRRTTSPSAQATQNCPHGRAYAIHPRIRLLQSVQ